MSRLTYTNRLANLLTGEGPVLQRASAGNPRGDGQLPKTMPPSRNAPDRGLSTEQAMSLIGVFRCLDILLTLMKQCGFRVFDGNDKEIKLSSLKYPRILNQPDPWTNRTEFIENTISSLLLHGNAYWLQERDGDKLIGLEVLHPDKVKIEADGFGRAKFFTYDGRKYKRDQIKHMKYMTVIGKPEGIGPIQACRETFRGALDVVEHKTNWFGKTGGAKGLLKTEQDLEQEDADLIAERWDNRGYKTAVIGKGVEYQSTLMNPEDAQFVAIQEFDTRQTATLFGLDAYMLNTPTGGSSLNYQNIEQAWIGIIRLGMARFLVSIQNALSELTDLKVRFNTDTLLRNDTKSRYEVYALAISAGIMTPDEAREKEGDPALTADQIAQLQAVRVKTSTPAAAAA